MGKMRIVLVAEDEPSIANVIERHLTLWGAMPSSSMKGVLPSVVPPDSVRTLLFLAS